VKAESVTRRLLGVLDSKWLTRSLNAYGLIGLVSALITAGLVVVALLGVGVVTLAVFAVWAAVSVAVILAFLASRRPSTVASPAARIAISAGLPGSTRALLASLERADGANRDYIAEASILIPVNNWAAAYELAQACADLEAEVGALVAGAPAFDERWSLLWAHKPSWAGEQPYLGELFTGARLDDLRRYMSVRGRQIGSMVDYLRTGDDKPVRHARALVKTEERKKQEAEDWTGTAGATHHASPLS
jgi:hypothetical protein